MNILDEYRFTSDIEPTDEQLSLLMKEVAKDVKERGEKAKTTFWSNFTAQMEIAKSKQLNFTINE
jgi:hypothetical protein